MSTPKALSRIPVLHTLVAFVLGIVMHRWWHCWWAPLVVLGLAVGLYLAIFINAKSPENRLSWRSRLTVALSMAAFSLGWLAAVIACPPRISADQRTGRVVSGRVVHLDYTDFSMQMTIKIIDRSLPPSVVLVSTRGCDYTFRAGDLVAWDVNLSEVVNLGNPDEMDYAGYLLNEKGIRYEQHIPVDKLRKIGYSPTLLSRLANLRRDLSLMVFNSSLSPQAQQLVNALLLGDSDVVDRETRQDFSSAGIAHVLALSGLHVAIIALLIWWLLFPLDYVGMKKTRLVFTLLAIMAFAVFTGLSPSVLRATIMIGFTFASIMFNRRSVPLNSLCVAALIILVFSPSSLYSVGFQLSFITVAAILLFSDSPLAFKTGVKVIDFLIAVALTSIVALLATVSLTAHYFHTIPLASVLSNLLVLPVLPVFMIAGAILLLTIAAGVDCGILTWCVNKLVAYIHWVSSFVNGIPMSHVNGVYVSTFSMIAYYVIAALIVIWLYRQDYRFLLAAGCALIVLLVHGLIIQIHTPLRGLVVFNSYTSTPILYYDDGTGFLWSPDDDEPDLSAFRRFHSGFLARHSIDELILVKNDTVVHLNDGMIKPPFALLMGKRLLTVGRAKWKQMTADNRMHFDDIIVNKRFHGTVSKLQELYDFDRLVITGAMQPLSLSEISNEIDSLGVASHSINMSGAFIVFDE